MHFNRPLIQLLPPEEIPNRGVHAVSNFFVRQTVEDDFVEDVNGHLEFFHMPREVQILAICNNGQLEEDLGTVNFLNPVFPMPEHGMHIPKMRRSRTALFQRLGLRLQSLHNDHRIFDGIPEEISNQLQNDNVISDAHEIFYDFNFVSEDPFFNEAQVARLLDYTGRLREYQNVYEMMRAAQIRFAELNQVANPYSSNWRQAFGLHPEQAEYLHPAVKVFQDPNLPNRISEYVGPGFDFSLPNDGMLLSYEFLTSTEPYLHDFHTYLLPFFV
jgi:hypothetical protein